MSDTQIKLKRIRKRKKHLLRRILLILLSLALVAGGALYAYESLRQKYTISYTGYSASTGSISNALSLSGSLTLIDSKAYVAAADTTVRDVYVSVGDNVKEGERLLRLSDGTTIKADFDGRINTLPVATGDDVAAEATLLQLADFTHMKVSMRVDEYDIANVYPGAPCTVTVTATEKAFSSTVTEINYISSSTGNVAYYSATAYVDVDDGIYPGMQVTVSIPQEEAENVVVLKMDALSFDSTNAAFVYKQSEDGTMTEVPVEVGVSNGNYVEIKSGVASGEEVYVQSEIETPSAVTGLLSGLFGGQQIMPGGMPNGFPGRTNDSNRPDFGNGNFGEGGGFSPPGGTGGGGRP